MRPGSKSNPNRPARATLGAAALAALAACTVGPDYQPPPQAAPGHWSKPAPQAAAGQRDLAGWWRGFHDARLSALVEQAMQGNLDLQAADARLAAARAERQAAAAAFWPSVRSAAGYQRARISPNALKGFLNSTVQGAGSGGAPVIGPLGEPFDLYQLGFDSAWELDVFGGVRRRVEAAEANAGAVAEGRQDLAISLTAEVAREYLEWAGLGRRLDIAQRHADIYRKLRELAADAYQEGLASPLDLRRAETELAAAEAAPPALEAQMAQARHRLAVLLGRPPAALDRELAAPPDAIPAPPPVPAGTPSDVLRRRADIRQAERNLAAQTAAVGAAVAELFPKLTLTGAVGLQSQQLSDFANLSSGYYGFGPRLSLPIFQAGQLLANIDIQQAKSQEALRAYEKTVLAALREVEDALAALDAEQRRRQQLAAAEAAGRASAEAAVALYAEGQADLQTVLDTRRAWLAAEDQRVQSELAWATGHIALFKALGGGWDAAGGHPPPAGQR